MYCLNNYCIGGIIIVIIIIIITIEQSLSFHVMQKLSIYNLPGLENIHGFANFDTR